MAHLRANIQGCPEAGKLLKNYLSEFRTQGSMACFFKKQDWPFMRFLHCPRVYIFTGFGRKVTKESSKVKEQNVF